LDLLILGTRQVAAEPGIFVGPLAAAFGWLINLIFTVVYAITPAMSLGISIIILTIIFRLLVLPLTLRGQRSLNKMREIQPELNAIDAKYGKSKDPEIMKKVQAEKSALMVKHGANPLKGCLPMLIQMPLFFGINFIMHQSFLYISQLGDLYNRLSESIQQVPNYIAKLMPLAEPLIPNNMRNNGLEAAQLLEQGVPMQTVVNTVGDFINLSEPADLSRVLNRFTTENWDNLYNQISQSAANLLPGIQDLHNQINNIENFFGLSMTESGGWGWPGVMIPILIMITMLAVSWLMQLRQYDPNATEQVKMQQRIMLVVMPIFMAFITVGLPAGVGLFWIVSQTFMVIQELILNKKAGIKFRLPFVKREE